MRQLSLRARLTVVVTLVFGLTLTLAAVIARSQVEDALLADTQASAEALLSDYLEELTGGELGVGIPDHDDTTRFVYLDQQGQEISAAEYEAVLLDAFVAQTEALELDEIPPEALAALREAIENSPEAPIAGSGGVAEGPGPFVMFDTGPIGAGTVEVITGVDPLSLDTSSDVIVVGTGVLVGGSPLTIGVSTPTEPVRDSLATVTRVGAIAIPTLTLVMAIITWFVVNRALRPVELISDHADRITAANLHQRVPQPESNDEIRHLATTMNAMLDRLDASASRQRQFISDASHELRSPVAATLATLEVADANPNTTDWPEVTSTLIDEQLRLAGLVDDLLLLARLEEAGAPSLDDDVDIDELALTEAQRNHRVPVQVHVEHPGRIRGNAQLLAHALRNLIDNAARHASNQVNVTITSDHTEAVVVVVDDDGPGIAPEDRDQLFGRFSRLDEARNRDEGGAGLGLAITHRVVTQHNGTVTCDTSPTGGARFTITLPHPQN